MMDNGNAISGNEDDDNLDNDALIKAEKPILMINLI